MNFNEWGYTILAVCAGIFIGYLTFSPKTVQSTHVNADTVYVAGKTDTLFIKSYFEKPAKVETVLSPLYPDGKEEIASMDTTICSASIDSSGYLIAICDSLSVSYHIPGQYFEVGLISSPYIYHFADTTYITVDSTIYLESGSFWKSVRDIGIGVAAGIILKEAVDASRK